MALRDTIDQVTMYMICRIFPTRGGGSEHKVFNWGCGWAQSLGMGTSLADGGRHNHEPRVPVEDDAAYLRSWIIRNTSTVLNAKS